MIISIVINHNEKFVFERVTDCKTAKYEMIYSFIGLPLSLLTIPIHPTSQQKGLVFKPVYLSVRVSVFPPVCQFVYSFCPSVCSICLTALPTLRLSVRLSKCLSICKFVFLSLFLCVCLSVSLVVCLSTQKQQ